MSEAFERIVDALADWNVTIVGRDQARAKCPAHDGRSNDSLAVRAVEGHVLVFCHGGCPTDDVLTALDMPMSALFDDAAGATYVYGDGRRVHRSPTKRFRQSGNTKGNALYRAERAAEAVAAGQTIFVVEGEKDCHAIEALGGIAVCSAMGAGKAHLADWSPLRGADVVIVQDRDDPGRRHARQVSGLLVGVAGCVKIVEASLGKDAADHIAGGHGIDEFTVVEAPKSLAEAHAAFRKWLGAGFDTDALDVALAAAAVERLDGDPLWLLLISGSGNAKTEIVQALGGAGATVTSTISSAGALLSATSKREKTKDATGGLLRKIGGRGVLVVKDVTSILSMSRDSRGEVLAALREVYDGRWERNVGTDGGKSLDWTGRLAVVGAVTTAWDRAHDVIASMGDRFVLLRMDSTAERVAAGRQAIGNTGSEEGMRAELAGVVGGVLAGMCHDAVTLTESESDVLLAAADLVTLARTGVDYDYRGYVIDAHAPEMPTRFAKQLAQVVRGGVALGMDRAEALRLAIRCARDSMPPLRLAIVDDLAKYPHSSTTEVRKRLGKPRTTVDRQLQALHILGVVVVDEVPTARAGKETSDWHYSLASGIDPATLRSAPDTRFGNRPLGLQKRETGVHPPTAKSGIGKPIDCSVCGWPLTSSEQTEGMHPDCANKVRGHPER
ncbi:hypothetical protein [Nocardia paucivorans]|uniref:hypothetical protein n=1 Tax=Nocardia paucivorans TaxID=114259 RepID=UPI001FDEC0A7|nr:hypothetical protein [Nocardia paucivorans]